MEGYGRTAPSTCLFVIIIQKQTIVNYLYVMIGGAIGALLRYGVARLCAGVNILAMPIGTLAVNLVGCFVLGILTGIGETYTGISKGLLLMLTVGMCGAFTTFSTFSGETIKAMENGHVVNALIYVVVSVVAGLLLFWTGKNIIH